MLAHAFLEEARTPELLVVFHLLLQLCSRLLDPPHCLDVTSTTDPSQLAAASLAVLIADLTPRIACTSCFGGYARTCSTRRFFGGCDRQQRVSVHAAAFDGVAFFSPQTGRFVFSSFFFSAAFSFHHLPLLVISDFRISKFARDEGRLSEFVSEFRREDLEGKFE